MTYVLNNYIIPGKSTYEPIIKENAEESFEDYVVQKINTYYDWTVTELCNKFHIEYQKKPKSLEAMLAYRMLGIKGNHAEEFEKANVVVKAIRIDKNNKIKELEEKEYIKLPVIPEECSHNAHMFYIKTQSLEERQKLIEFLKQAGINAVFHYIPLHSAPAGKKYGTFLGKTNIPQQKVKSC